MTFGYMSGIGASGDVSTSDGQVKVLKSLYRYLLFVVTFGLFDITDKSASTDLATGQGGSQRLD
eukprot:CAMPEP_0119494424 /NCGR_PEP_ID=MMETSP1344-20130328/18382_1 /TAXON_ID=236787 /ORGANISM="Florenciella parvula, Strain CCMP2471" /LENGTH=63 /DNA_ID=CAMNT_0007529927 /DNA_START=64 /DNA_END=252 /DNA_ORIENTATION=+